MSKCLKKGAKRLLFLLATAFLAGVPVLAAANAPVTYSSLSEALVQRAEADLERIKALVSQGTLPKSRLNEAQESLADAEDQATLAKTLYSSQPVQDLTASDADKMLAAAQRRLQREELALQGRQKLLDMGIIAKSDLTSIQDELESRRRVVDLAENRVKLLNELQQMAKAEEDLERTSTANALAPLNPSAKDVMIRYEGNGQFTLGDLPTVSAQFEKQFHKPLPVSALGQTLVHQSMGLDHRNRVDVALNPDQPEGIWLRALLERLQIPYLAFRSALAGAATAPHIHIGLGSSRLKLASR